MNASRRGAALVFAVLLCTAAVLLAHGVLVIAGAELRAAHASVRILRAGAVAEDVVRRIDLRTSHVADTLTPGRVAAIGAGERVGVAWIARARRLSDELWLSEAEARVAGTRRRLGRPVWRLDPRRRIDELGAVVVTGPGATVSGLVRVDAGAADEVPDPAPVDGCGVDGSRPGDRLPAWRVAPDSVAALSLGLLDPDTLRAIAGPELSGVVRPAPVERLGSCVEIPANWGEPGGTGACAAYTVVRSLSAGTRVEDGVGQGLVVAQGDLTLANTRFHGLLLVAGHLRLEAGSRLTGVAVALGGVAIGTASGVSGSRCWAESSLRTADLRDIHPIPGSGWIGLDGY